MDAIAARAVSIIMDCTSLGDGRINLDPGVMERLGIAINRYNGLTQNQVTIRPGTIEDRNAMFFMCVDVALAALNIQIGNLSPEYTQALTTIGVLATGEIPFSVQAMDSIVRITGTMATWGPTRITIPPFARAPEMQQSGRYFVPAGNNHAAYVNPWTVEVSLNGGTAAVITPALQPRGIIATVMYLVWHPIAVYAVAQGATARTQQGVTLTVGGVNIAAGTIFAWDTVAPINVANPGARNGMISVRVLWYTSLDKTLQSLPDVEATLARCYSFQTPAWHALRGTILHHINLPPNNPPMFAPNTRNDMLAYLFMSLLADAYTALRPQFTVPGMLAAPAVLDRAFAQGAYR
ncbi:VP7 [Lebombo virus]|uniref:Core protein VP7 n=1 Tax=Lebombo virus TaxID=40057 RepID=W5QLX4_9REOV|nr:VP7 [Lebombo virus]AFX73382.1 VP7 [Lebombo virus]